MPCLGKFAMKKEVGHTLRAAAGTVPSGQGMEKTFGHPSARRVAEIIQRSDRDCGYAYPKPKPALHDLSRLVKPA